MSHCRGDSFLVLLVVMLFAGPDTQGADSNVVRLTRSYYPKFFLRYSPDGSHIAYCRHHRNLRGTNRVLVGLRLITSDGKDDRPLLSEFDSQVQIQEHPCWSPDGRRLVISGGGNDTGNSSKDTFVCSIDAEFKATGLRKVVPGQGVGLGEEPCFSPDGKHLAFVSVDETLWTVDADGKNKARVVQVDGSYCHQPAWSPDGQWIAFATDRDGDVEIYKVRWDGTDLTRLTQRDGFDCRPCWSRDGQWLLFTSNRNGNHDLFLMADDGHDVRRLTHHTALDDHGAFAPDGKSVAFVSMRDGGFDIYRTSLPQDVRIGPPPTIQPMQADVPAGLVARYSFDHPSSDSSVVRDEAGRNHLKLFGARVVSDSGHGSLEFDGSDDYAVAVNSAQLRIKGPLTISLWVRPGPFNGNGYLLARYGWNIYVSSDGRPRFETRSAANDAWVTLAASAALPADQWTFTTAVFDPDSETMHIYINGRLSAEQARTDGAIGAVDAYPLQFGSYISKTQQFRGRLDEIRIYGKALSGSEIAAEYKAQSKLVGSNP